MPVFPHFLTSPPRHHFTREVHCRARFQLFLHILDPPDFQSPLQSQVSKVRNAPHRAYWGVDGQNYKYLTFLSTWITNLRHKDCIKDVKDLFFWMKNEVKNPLNVLGLFVRETSGNLSGEFSLDMRRGWGTKLIFLLDKIFDISCGFNHKTKLLQFYWEAKIILIWQQSAYLPNCKSFLETLAGEFLGWWERFEQHH